MPTLEQLRFAQRFPFSPRAKAIVKELNPLLEEIGEETLERASILVSYAYSAKPFTPQINTTDLLEREITAFPVAKILVSLLADASLYRGFASVVAKSTFAYIEDDNESEELAFGLASDLGIKYEIPENGKSFVSMPLPQFLSIKFSSLALKLVNQKISSGKVFLNKNSFYRFLSEVVYAKVLEDLPVPTNGLPKFFKTHALQAKQQARKSIEREFSFKIGGKLNFDAFPPCYADLYKKQMSGENLPHMARFLLASFLNAIGMPEAQILEAFKKSPNFDEKIASYQVSRIVKQNYTPASCEKVKGYGFCPEANCNEKHPLRFYRRKLRQSSAKPKE